MTELCSGSTKPAKAPAELGTDSAELARDSSELLVGKRRDGGSRNTERSTDKGKERDMKRRGTKKYMQ